MSILPFMHGFMLGPASGWLFPSGYCYINGTKWGPVCASFWNNKGILFWLLFVKPMHEQTSTAKCLCAHWFSQVTLLLYNERKHANSFDCHVNMRSILVVSLLVIILLFIYWILNLTVHWTKPFCLSIWQKGKIRPVHLVDVPGHSRLRPKLDEFLPQAAGIVFVVDALEFLPNCRAASE